MKGALKKVDIKGLTPTQKKMAMILFVINGLESAKKFIQGVRRVGKGERL